MNALNSKRNFIFGRISAQVPLRPPWAIEEQRFVDSCNRCGECVRQCPVNVIRIADGGFPEMNFSQSGCDFCGVCVEVCETAALQRGKSAPFNLVSAVSDDCFSERGVICRSCAEICETQAIRFNQVVGGIAHVIMNASSCTGCGECVSICPANAITIQHRTVPETAI